MNVSIKISSKSYYPFGMVIPGRSFSTTAYKFGYNKGSEKDDEISGTGNHFSTFYREGDTRLATWWGVYPKASEQPWQSTYSFMDGNPIWHNDPNGDDIDKNASGFKDAEKRATPEYNKKGKQTNNLYEPKFAEMYNKWNDDHNVMISFNHQEGDGSIKYNGCNDDCQQVYSVHWDPKGDKQLGSSGIFEESFHLNEALEGNEMKFPDKPNSGVMYVDINDEVRAKQWVANNINISMTYSAEESKLFRNKFHSFPTEYGHIKTLTADGVRNFLRRGNTFNSVITNDDGFGSGGTLGGPTRDEQSKTLFFENYSNPSKFPDGDRRP